VLLRVFFARQGAAARTVHAGFGLTGDDPRLLPNDNDAVATTSPRPVQASPYGSRKYLRRSQVEPSVFGPTPSARRHFPPAQRRPTHFAERRRAFPPIVASGCPPRKTRFDASFRFCLSRLPSWTGLEKAFRVSSLAAANWPARLRDPWPR
jgi:hypothetical protein